MDLVKVNLDRLVKLRRNCDTKMRGFVHGAYLGQKITANELELSSSSKSACGNCLYFHAVTRIC